MNKDLELRQTIAKNLIYFRKHANLTQIELAEKLNYSDKSVSKWERAESVPDIYVLKKIADIYNITVNDLLSQNPQKSINNANQFKIIVSLLSASIVWLVAAIAYVITRLVATDKGQGLAYIAFVYAIPVSAIVLLVFNCLWGKQLRLVKSILITIITWGFLVAIYLTVLPFRVKNFWLIFIIGIPIQVAVVLWYFLRFDIRAIKNNYIQKRKQKIHKHLQNP